MKKLFAIVVLVVVAWGVVPAQAQVAVDDAYLIQPGVGIGPVHVGAPVDDALRLWGPPRATQRLTNGNTQYEWYEASTTEAGTSHVAKGGPGVIIDRASIILGVSVYYDSRYHLPSGLRTANVQHDTYDVTALGASDVEVKMALGEPEAIVARGAVGDIRWRYLHQGVSIDLTEMHLFRPNQIRHYVYQISVYARTP
jgi:hypothetical protein